jgi:hypothetical protein
MPVRRQGDAGRMPVRRQGNVRDGGEQDRKRMTGRDRRPGRKPIRKRNAIGSFKGGVMCRLRLLRRVRKTVSHRECGPDNHPDALEPGSVRRCGEREAADNELIWNTSTKWRGLLE